jgi:hypothetical protein
VEGGDGVGSRVRIAAAACLVASGLFAGGAGVTIAFAEPGGHHGDSGGNDANDSIVRDGFDSDGPGPTSKNDGTPPGVNGTTPGVGPLPGGTGNEHSGDVGTGKPPKARDEKPAEQNDDERDEHHPGPGVTPPSTKPTSTPTEESPPPEQPGCDEDNNDDHCSPGWPWWPWPWEPGQPPGPGGGGGGGGGAVEVPSGRPQTPPEMQLPPELQPPASGPTEPGVISPAPGVGVAAAELSLAPLTLPVIVAPSMGLGGGSGAGPGAPSAPTLPGTPRGFTAEPPAAREPLPATAGSNLAVPASSYRAGYGEYLRSARLSQVAALAVPGVTGILVLTGAGGLVGYRQAKAGHAVRAGGTARFVN